MGRAKALSVATSGENRPCETQKIAVAAATMADPVAGSSNGRTPDSGSGSQGSSPCPAASRTRCLGGQAAKSPSCATASVRKGQARTGFATRRFGFVTLFVVSGILGAALAASVAGGFPAHSSPCHVQHTCPSDHHTYVWTDTSTGLLWDCAEPGASEYDPSRDTTTIVYQGLTYYCRSGTANVTTATESTSTSTTTTTTTETTTSPTTPGPGQPSIILPDLTISPGALNPAVRQGTISRTICVKGWTKTIRPPVTYTNALKIQQMVLYEETSPPSA